MNMRGSSCRLRLKKRTAKKKSGIPIVKRTKRIAAMTMFTMCSGTNAFRSGLDRITVVFIPSPVMSTLRERERERAREKGERSGAQRWGDARTLELQQTHMLKFSRSTVVTFM